MLEGHGPGYNVSHNSSPTGLPGNQSLEQDLELQAFDVVQKHASSVIIIVSSVVMGSLVVGNILHKFKVNFIPESLVVIFFGVGCGFVLRHFFGEHGIYGKGEFTLAKEGIINKDLLEHVFLPIIIFEAGWSLKNKEFISQLPYILIFAVGGTVICMAVVAVLIHATSDMHSAQGWQLAFTYGALIAAVDPVATLATYAHLNVEPLLNILVMGESIINDAVAITLFHVLNEAEFTREQTADRIMLRIAGNSCVLLFGSIALGLVGGLLLSLIVALTHMRHTPTMAILYVLWSAYLMYHVADILKLSGIITVLFAGMIMSAHVKSHLSIEGSLLCAFLLKQLGSLADMSVFLLVGVAAAFATPSGLKLGGFVMLFCLLGRALATFPLAIMCNGIKMLVGEHLEDEKRLIIPLKHMFMMWHAGLRGGIALVLCLELNNEWVDKAAKAHLVEATIFLICVFLLVFGGSTEICLKLLKIPIGNPPVMYLGGGRFSSGLYKVDNFLKSFLHGGEGVHMQHGSVLNHLMKEAAVKDEVERRRREMARSSEERYQAVELFGFEDPTVSGPGWTAGSAGDERWLALYHESVGEGGSSSLDGSESSGSAA